MLQSLFNDTKYIQLIGLIFAFGLTFTFTYFGKGILPTDRGKEFAHDGQAAKGKPQGAGLFFVLIFVLCGFVFGELSIENSIYLILVGACMLTGYMDDASTNPWGRLKKGLLDFVLAFLISINYIFYNGSVITFRLFGNYTLDINPFLMGALIICVVWGSINVTNCADGVDGLSGTLAIVTLSSIYLMDVFDVSKDGDKYFILLFIACLLAYLWFNATPSILMMGDAGSRAMGMVIAIAVIKTGSIFAYLIVALVLILDGGLGLLKITLIKTIKVHIMKNIRTPLHDQVRKNMGWSNTQNVFRFVIIQIVINAVYLYLIK